MRVRTSQNFLAENSPLIGVFALWFLSTSAFAGAVNGSTSAPNHIFPTEVYEVRASSIDGNQVLTLEIADVTGPQGCKSSTVLLTNVQPDSARGVDLEALALQAMLESQTVLLSVPIEQGECVNGNPTVADMWILE